MGDNGEDLDDEEKAAEDEGDTAVDEVHGGGDNEGSEADVEEMKEEVDPDHPEVEAREKEDGGEKEEKGQAEEEEVDIDLDDPEVEAAATKIQAGFKGHRTRKEMKDKQLVNSKLLVPKDLKTLNSTIEDEIVDIDLNDPEVEEAATKIQAGYRGMSARKEVQGAKEMGAVKEVEEESVVKDNEEVDIDLEDPDVEAAATKIQAGFKGHQARKELREKQLVSGAKNLEDANADQDRDDIDIDLNDPDVEAAATKIQAGFKGHQARKEMKGKMVPVSKADTIDGNEGKDESIDIDLKDPEVEAAATKIQAGFKGHKTRKEMKDKQLVSENQIHVAVDDNRKVGEDMNEEVDIDLDDPDVEAAATKIQAGFKGHRARKEIREKRPIVTEVDTIDSNKGKDESIDIDLEDPDVEVAATKIQAGFKGHKARKELREGKKSGDKKEKDDVNHVELEDRLESEAIDIDLEDPEVEAAATKIQAGFKGHKARKGIKSKKDAIVDDAGAMGDNDDMGNGKKGTTEPHEKDEDIDIDLEDPEVEAAATKIQAGFKGHKARKEIKSKKDNMGNGEQDTKEQQVKDSDIDIDLNDPEVEAAATKIQAGFKGHKAREEIKNKKDNIAKDADTQNENNNTGNSNQDTAELHKKDDDVDIDLDDPEVEAAATKIQAGFKGHKARKEIKNKKDNVDKEAISKKQDVAVAKDEPDSGVAAGQEKEAGTEVSPAGKYSIEVVYDLCSFRTEPLFLKAWSK